MTLSPRGHAMSATPVLSLVIATRERAVTLGHSLQTALNQQSQAFEVIVSDNFSADATAQVVADIRDSRLRYFRTDARLSMCDNYEFALQQARGEYVVFIGDDDAVMPGAIDRLLGEIRDGEADTIYMWPLHVYDWPVGDQPAKIGHLAPQTSRSRLDLAATARRVVTLGGWKYYKLPSPYHCAVPRRFLDQIRERTGRVFHSTQPDVFTAMALPTVARHVVNLGRTVTLNGRSASSNGLAFVVKSALQNIQKFIAEYGGYRFHASLAPGFPGQANMIPDAVLIACDLFPEFYGGTRFNYDSMWAYICRVRFVSPRDVIRRRAEIRKSHPFHVLPFLAFLAVHEAAVVRRKLLNRQTDLGPVGRDVPATISAFVAALQMQQAGPKAIPAVDSR